MAASEQNGQRPRWAPWLVAAVVVGALSLLLLQIEWVEQEIDAGYGEEARRNAFHAAERFLERHGIETETAEGLELLDALPSTDDLILISSSRIATSDRRRDALRAWVGKGGQLVVVASEVWDYDQATSRDPLLDSVGIYLVEAVEAESDDGDPSDEGRDDDPDAAMDAFADALADDDGDADERSPTLRELLTQGQGFDRCPTHDVDTTVVPLASGEELRVGLFGSHRIVIDDEEGFVSTGPNVGQIAQVGFGSGRVTAATSLGIFENDRVGCVDHAYLLWSLAEPAAKVWLVHDPDVLSVAELLARHFPATALGLLACLAVWLAHSSLRFGVAPRSDEGPRRELLEHLEASARFLWLRDSLGPLLERVRDEKRGGTKDREAAREGMGRRELVHVVQALAPAPRGRER